MNIYLITEDGGSFCIRAKTMLEAVTVCENSYLEGAEEDNKDFNKKIEQEYYHENILESCAFVEVLRN